MTKGDTSSPENMPSTVPFDAEIDQILQYFDIADTETTISKLRYMHAEPHNLELWADFDNTLTTRNFGIYEALRNVLPIEGQVASDQERRTNLAKERSGSLSEAENISWTKHEIDRYSQYGITTEDIIRAVESVRLRAGARRLFSYCHQAGINRHIISASIADAIERVGLRTTHIHSNKLFIEDGIVVGWDEENILHSHNKHAYARVMLAEADDTGTARGKIVLGDISHDADMLPGDDVLRIRVHGRHGNNKNYLAQSFTPSAHNLHYDMVLRTESLMPVAQLLRLIVDGH